MRCKKITSEVLQYVVIFVNLLYHKITKDKKEVVNMVSALNVANNILKRARDNGIDITPMKLQKLLYFVYKKYYKDTKNPLFSERFEAWQYGPIIESVYHEFKQYGSNHIKRYHEDSAGNVWLVNEALSAEFKEALDYVCENYFSYDGIALSKLTHKKDTAWYNALINNKRYLKDEDIGAEGWLL